MVIKMRTGIILMLISAFSTSTGQLMWKLGIDKISLIPIGFLFYGLGALFMIKSLQKEKITVVYPVMCIGYIVSMGYGELFLGESITTNKIIAIGLIIIGVYFNSYDK